MTQTTREQTRDNVKLDKIVVTNLKDLKFNRELLHTNLRRMAEVGDIGEHEFNGHMKDLKSVTRYTRHNYNSYYRLLRQDNTIDYKIVGYINKIGKLTAEQMLEIHKRLYIINKAYTKADVLKDMNIDIDEVKNIAKYWKNRFIQSERRGNTYKKSNDKKDDIIAELRRQLDKCMEI